MNLLSPFLHLNIICISTFLSFSNPSHLKEQGNTCMNTNVYTIYKYQLSIFLNVHICIYLRWTPVHTIGLQLIRYHIYHSSLFLLIYNLPVQQFKTTPTICHLFHCSTWHIHNYIWIVNQHPHVKTLQQVEYNPHV